MARPKGTNECCYDEDGNFRPENVKLVPDHPNARPDVSVSVCQVCHCRHFEAVADAGVIGLKGAPIGAESGPQFFVMEDGVLRSISAHEFFERMKSAQEARRE